ncbi:MAG: MerR family transcriptional regulator [Muribaculaceae bacterium]|nr:MerR family transcriptional regulator [Muribaculaceae bacterium]MDE7111090.1 MerR family transcriptional regulator [Muribaculaceae bacterium]
MESIDLTKKYYRIREVSELIDVPASTLRYWESMFPKLRPRRNAKGTRYYTPADVETLQQIRYLVHDKGLKIDAAIQQMRIGPDTVATKARAIERLEKIRAQLISLRDSLTRLKA